MASKALLVLLVGILVAFEATEDAVVLNEGNSPEQLSGEAVVEEPPQQAATKSCADRKAEAEEKLKEATRNLDKLGLEVLKTQKATSDLNHQAENGEALKAGIYQARRGFPEKYQKLQFRVKQKSLARSPAVEMAEKSANKVSALKEKLAGEKALLEKGTKRLAELKLSVKNLKGENEIANAKTKRTQEVLDRKVALYENKFEAELKKLGMQNKEMSQSLEVSEKKRKQGLETRKSKLKQEIEKAKSEMSLLQPQVSVEKAKIDVAQGQYDAQKKSADKKLASANAALEKLEQELVQEGHQKTEWRKKIAQEQATKEEIRRQQAQAQMQEVAKEMTLEEKRVAKNAAIKKKQAFEALQARNQELRDEIAVTTNDADIKEQAIRYKLVKDKARAESDGLKAIADYKAQLANKTHTEVQNVVEQAQAKLQFGSEEEAAAKEEELKKELASLKESSKADSVAPVV